MSTTDHTQDISPARLRLVVTASSAGTTFEWYDFFLGVPLAGLIAKLFFAGLGDTVGYLFALLSFAAGFAFRPLGAVIFGRMGDRQREASRHGGCLRERGRYGSLSRDQMRGCVAKVPPPVPPGEEK